MKWLRPSHDEQLVELWATAMTQEQIAARMGFSAAYISIKAGQIGLEPRYEVKSLAERHYLNAEAKRRNIDPTSLKRKIIRTVLRDKLIDAVLDDAKDFADVRDADHRTDHSVGDNAHSEGRH